MRRSIWFAAHADAHHDTATHARAHVDARPEPAPEDDSDATTCVKPTGVQRISFSKTKYRHIRAHYLVAVRRGWPRVLVLNRPGADARRDRLLEDYAHSSRL